MAWTNEGRVRGNGKMLHFKPSVRNDGKVKPLEFKPG